MPTPTYIAIATTTLTSSASSIDFTSIPATYTDLLIKVSSRFAAGSDYSQFNIRYNNDTGGNYRRLKVYGNGSTTVSNTGASEDMFYYIDSIANGGTANTFGNAEIYIIDYTSSNNKTICVNSVADANITEGYCEIYTGLWTGSSAAINRVTLVPNGQFAAHTTATLYGIKNS